jgi:hypothetical protein
VEDDKKVDNWVQVVFLKEEQIVDGSRYKQLGRNSKSYV